MKPEDFDRFMTKVDTNGPEHPYEKELGKCWIWTAGKHSQNYGNFWLYGNNIRSHRAMYFHCYPDEDTTLFICHNCDRPECVNPQHLFGGTNKDNMQDASNKGRLKSNEGSFKEGSEVGKEFRFEKGSIPSNKKTTPEIDQEIVEKWKNGQSIRSLAREYGIDRTGIRSRIIAAT